MEKQKYYAASFSGGKDSTAMVLRLIEIAEPLDEVIFCDTTMEFPAMLRHVEKVKQVVEAAGIKFTTLRAEHDFEYYMLDIKRKKPNPKYGEVVGYGWPSPLSRWCTKELKIRPIDRYFKALRRTHDVIQYIGIAADEEYRLARKHNQDEAHEHPLVKWGWSEADAMAYCRAKGYDWEGLYDIFGRVSCWLCPLQSLAELRKTREHFPELWDKLREMDDKSWKQFKREGSVRDLEKRFDFEEALEAMGEKTNTRLFYTDLKRVQSGEATIEEVIKERQPIQLKFDM